MTVFLYLDPRQNTTLVYNCQSSWHVPLINKKKYTTNKQVKCFCHNKLLKCIILLKNRGFMTGNREVVLWLDVNKRQSPQYSALWCDLRLFRRNVWMVMLLLEGFLYGTEVNITCLKELCFFCFLLNNFASLLKNNDWLTIKPGWNQIGMCLHTASLVTHDKILTLQLCKFD